MLDRLFSRRTNEPHEHGPFKQPTIFGDGTKLAPDVVVRTIRLNAGTMPACELARRMGERIETVERLARANGISLRYPPADETDEPEPRGA